MAQGPKAPKDPTKKRCGFFIMLDNDIEATERVEGKPSQDIYLDGGRLVDKAKINGGITDETILKLIETSEGFHQLVYSIGISVSPVEDNPVKEVGFVLHFYGKKDKYNSGTLYRLPMVCDGAEVIINMDDIPWSEDDYVLGKIAFEFENPGERAVTSIKFYLKDGYFVPEMEIDPPVSFGTEVYENHISSSLLNLGNVHRLKKAMEKGKRGEEVTIGFIGGSITQGAGAKPINTQCYSYRAYSQLRELIGENLRFIKAGVGGTPSELGMIRYDRDVLRDGNVTPDIVVVEFAVNDEGDETKGECFESLVAKILNSPNKPAVVLLFSVFSDDYNLQERLAPIGYHYNLPMVSVKDAVSPQFLLSVEKGRVISKRQYFYDSFHPTNAGHRVMADCLGHLWKVVDGGETQQEDIAVIQEPFMANDFQDVHLIDRKDNQDKATILCGSFTGIDTELQLVEMDDNASVTPQFPNNWMHMPSSKDESFKIKTKSQSLLLVYKDAAEVNVGKADVFLDGEYLMTVDPHIIGWTHCNALILYRQKPILVGSDLDAHEIEIRMAKGDEDKYFTILGFGFVE